MFLCSNRYLKYFLLRLMVTIALIFSFSIAASPQAPHNHVVETYTPMNPLLYAAFKKPVKPDPLLSEYVKPSRHELMYWPNFPLNASQLEARDREWERRNKQTIGGQIISDITSGIIKNQVNSLIYGKKMPVAVAPKF